MINYFSKFGVLLFFAGAAVLSCLAQNNSCNLQFGIYEFETDGSSEQFPIKDSKIILTGDKSKKTIKVSQNSGTAAVSGAIEGKYKVTISKDGFQNTSKEFTLDCGLADLQNTVLEIIFLWKGDSRQTTKMYGGSFGKSDKTEAQNFSATEPINGKAVTLSKPKYPNAARAVKASGAVQVEVLINELGYVISAKAISGHPLLRSAAVESAKSSKFAQTILEGLPIKVSGIIVYNFVP